MKTQLCKKHLLILSLVVLLQSFFPSRAQEMNIKEEPVKYKVIFFLAPDCPISQQYTRTINQFFLKYEKVCSIVTFMGNDQNYKTKRAQNKFVNKYKFLPQIQTDLNHQIAKSLGATITPEVFILNEQNTILYHGAIDNWFYELGKTRPQITEYYLEDAMQGILQNKAVKLRETKAIGCFIEYD